MAVTTWLVKEVTARKIEKLLQTGGSAQKATLATLRRGVGHTPGELPQLWGEFLSGMPQEMFGYGGNPSRAEWAIYIAITMFALHQQGKNPGTNSMHKEGETLGKAISYLVHSEEDKPRILRRFNALATATDMRELSTHLRSMVQLLRTEDIPLDYVSLAADLFLYQDPARTHQVRLIWGQDFHRKNNKDNDAEERKEANAHE